MRKDPNATKKYQAEYYQRNKERLNAYKREYEKNVMRGRNKRYGFYVDRELAGEFEEKLAKNGENITDVLLKAIKKYIGKEK